MISRQRPLFWILLVASLAVGTWWLFHVPYRPDRVFAAIPANASVVSVHHNLAGEWDSFLTNPLLLRAMHAGGVPDADLDGITTNRTIREWVGRLASDKTVVAYVPALGPQQKPALVCASWIGGQSRRLRWKLAWLKSRDLVPVKLNEGQLTVWLTRTKFGKTNLRLSLALTEGMVLACISEDPVGVRPLLEAAENYPGRMTLSAAGTPDRARAMLAGSPAPRHWGWIETRHDLMSAQFNLEPERLTLVLMGHPSLAAAAPLNETTGLKTVTDLTGSTSDLVITLPMSWMEPILGREQSLLWLNALRPLYDTAGVPPDALAFVALLDQHHNGRLRGPMGSTLRAFIKGVKTPTVLLGIQVGSGEAANKRVTQVITILNSQYNLGLALHPMDGEGMPGLTLIEESRKGFYGSFEPEERVAYAMTGDWMILASNASVLKKLLAEKGTNDPAWGSLPSPGPTALGWINLEGIAPTAKNTAGVLKLATLVSSSDKSAEWRDKLNQTGLWTEVLRSLGQAKVTLDTTGSTFQAILVIGKP